jgi:hypothetical protein
MKSLFVMIPKVQQDMQRNAKSRPMRKSRGETERSSVSFRGERRTSPATMRIAAPKTMGEAGSPRKIQVAGTARRG